MILSMRSVLGGRSAASENLRRARSLGLPFYDGGYVDAVERGIPVHHWKAIQYGWYECKFCRRHITMYEIRARSENCPLFPKPEGFAW